MVGGASRPVWVDRNTELGLLGAALEQVRAGRPRAVLVMGETGVGKSALINEFVRRTELRTFVGRCFKFGGGGVPYLPLVEILRAFAREAAPAEVVRVLGPARADLARLLPELAPPGTADGGRRDVEVAAIERARMFERLLGVAERLGHDHPTLIVIEDAHWIDQSTRDILVFLLHSVRRAQLMLMITCRNDELPPGHPFLAITAELERADVLERVDLNRLERPDVEQQIEQLLGRRPERQLVDNVVARSGGNPLFVEELVKAGGGIDEPVPTGLRDILLGRVAALSPPSRALVRFAAVAGQSVSEPVLTAAGLSGNALAAALREAADEQLLVPSPTSGQPTYEFRHQLLQEVVYDDQLPVERERAHAAIAQVLSNEQPAGPGATAELAHHWYAAREFGRALPTAINAGVSAYLAYAFAEADRQFQRALNLWPQVPFADDRVGIDHVALLEYASESATRIGDYERAIALGKDALAELDPIAEPERAGAAHSRMRWVLWESGNHAAALADAQEAARLVPAEPPSALRANVVGHLAALRMLAGDLAGALELATEAERVARAAGQPALAEEGLATGIRGLCLVRLGDVDAGLDRVRAAVAIAERLDHVTGIAVAYSQYAGILDELGRAEETLAVAQEGIAAARRLGLERTFGALLRNSASHALYELGRWDEVEILAESSPGATLVDIGRGRFGDAASALANHAAGSAGADEQTRLMVSLAHAELALGQGKPEEAGDLVDDRPGRPHQPALQRELIMLGARAQADLAATARAANDAASVKAAETAARSVTRHLEEDGERLGLAQQATVAGELGRALGRSKPEAWAKAVEAWQAAGRPYRLAYCAFRQAESVLQAGGDRHDAEPPLHHAHQVAASLGAAPLVHEIEILARRLRVNLGKQTHDAPTTDPNELTQREREVLALMAVGQTNREIGEALFISPKTASVHVSNIYAKLGVERRIEAVQVARQLGLLNGEPDHRP